MVCKKCGHIMSEQMSFCSRCGTVVGKENNDKTTEAKDSIRMAFAPSQATVVQTTPAEPAGFVKGKTPSNAPAAAPTKAAVSVPPVEESKKRSVLPFVIPVASVAVLAVGASILLNTGNKTGVDAAANNQRNWVSGVGKTSTEGEDWNNDSLAYTDATGDANVQKKVMIMVSDSFGPIADAEVKLLDSKGETAKGVYSKEDGSTTLTNVEPGTYTLTISKKGYEDISETLTLDENNMAYGLLLERELQRQYTTVTVRTKSYVEDVELQDVNINLYAKNSQNPDDPYITAKSDEYGLCSLQNFPCGDFTIKCDAPNYSLAVKNVDVSVDNEQNLFTVYLMPVPAADEAYVVLDWNDPEMDLDLCAFNDTAKEYVNVTHATATNGSMLFADQTGKAGIEAILLKDADTDAAQTVYVLDTTTALTGSRESNMRNSDVHITIYKNGEEPEIYSMSGETTAPVWTVGTLQSGNFEKLNVNQYTSILTDHLWVGDIVGVKGASTSEEE